MALETCSKKFVLKPDTALSKGEKGDQGPQGPPGVGGSLPISSDDVDYKGTDLTTIIEGLLYEALEITSFTSSTLVYEKGVVLANLFVTWAFNKAIESQSITGVGVTPPTLGIGDRNVNLTLANITTNTLITLTADDVDSDLVPPVNENLTVAFQNKIYWGKATIPGAINSAFVLTLSNELKATRQKAFSVTTGAGEYIWFASPVAYGFPTFTSNGFLGGLDSQGTISFTNASGHTEDYYVFRSANDNLGLTNIEVL